MSGGDVASGWVTLLLVVASTAWAWRLLRRAPRLDAVATIPSASTTEISVVVPARNEERTLPLLLTHLAAVTLPPGCGLDVVVVDDGSTDATGDVVRGFAPDGVRLVEAPPPPPGWTGKAWACHQGAQATTGDAVLFLDADTLLAPDALGRLLTVHAERGGLVSVQPRHHPVRPYEQLSAFFNVMSVLASGAFGRRPSAVPMAYGPVLLASRSDYDACGGHPGVRADILDDAALAAAFARRGLPVTCLLGGDAARMRMYPGGFGQLWSGWTKNFASGARSAATGPALAATVWLAVHWAVVVAVVGLTLTLVRGERPAPTAAVLTVATYLLVAFALRSLLGVVGRFRWWSWALFPGPLLVFTVVFGHSALLTLVRGRVTWRGRAVPTRDPNTDDPRTMAR